MVKTFLMETVSGKPVFAGLGGFRYMVEEKTPQGITRARARAFPWDSEHNRGERLKNAERFIGEPCRWIDGPETKLGIVKWSKRTN